MYVLLLKKIVNKNLKNDKLQFTYHLLEYTYVKKKKLNREKSVLTNGDGDRVSN